jgi:hypothetical protein
MAALAAAAQGLKPCMSGRFAARLKSCPDTKRSPGAVFGSGERRWVKAPPFPCSQILVRRSAQERPKRGAGRVRSGICV